MSIESGLKLAIVATLARVRVLRLYPSLMEIKGRFNKQTPLTTLQENSSWPAKEGSEGSADARLNTSKTLT